MPISNGISLNNLAIIAIIVTESESDSAVVSVDVTTLRNNFNGYVGFGFTIGSTDLIVTDLGRYVVSSSDQIHTVNIRDSSGIVVATADIDTTGITVNTFSYISIIPVTLTADNTYYLMSEETAGGDQWGDTDTIITVTSYITDLGSYFGSATGVPNENRASPFTYGPPNFKYHI